MGGGFGPLGVGPYKDLVRSGSDLIMWVRCIRKPIARPRRSTSLRIYALSIALLLALTPGCMTLSGDSDARLVRAKNKVAPALVHIRPVKEVFRGGRRQEISVLGSGFIISKDGYVITNEHVAGQSKLVRVVLFDKEEVDAEVVGTDKFTDIAVLKLQTQRTDLPVVAMALDQKLEAGQTVLALGSPHGLSRSVSKGIVSVTDRFLQDSGTMVSPYNTWIQTDAAINPGNSGGPLVNLSGKVVGVNARRLGGADNVGFAIPVDIAEEVWSEIIEHGRVERSWIGLTLQEMVSVTDDAGREGVVIGDVDPLSPAFEAGVRPGDVMLSIDGGVTNARFEEDLPAVRKRLADFPVGEELTLDLLRAAQGVSIQVVTEAKGDIKGREVELGAWGFTVSELTPAIVRRAQLPSRQGVYVSGTRVGGIASIAGLRQGDIILGVDGEEITELSGFQDVYGERLDSKRPMVLLDVKRGAVTLYVLVKQGAATPAGTGD